MNNLISWMVGILAKGRQRGPQGPAAPPAGDPLPPQPEDRFDIYHPKERLIFHYWNGDQEIAADPMVLYKKVAEKGVEIDHDWKASRTNSKFAMTSHNNLVKNIRAVFDLKSFEQGGLTEPECIDLLDFFLVFVETVKKNSSPSPISPSETSPPTLPSSEGSPPTPNTSDSGPTGSESSTDRPPSSPSEPA